MDSLLPAIEKGERKKEKLRSCCWDLTLVYFREEKKKRKVPTVEEGLFVCVLLFCTVSEESALMLTVCMHLPPQKKGGERQTAAVE